MRVRVRGSRSAHTKGMADSEISGRSPALLKVENDPGQGLSPTGTLDSSRRVGLEAVFAVPVLKILAKR